MRRLALILLALCAFVLASCVPPPPQSAISVMYPKGHCLMLPEVGQVMERTSVLQKYQLQGSLTAAEPGQPLLDRVQQTHPDAIMVTDAVALQLLTQGFRGKIVGSYGPVGRAGLVVGSHSAVQRVQDLHGKTIAATAETTPWALVRCWLAEAGPASVRLEDQPVQGLAAHLEGGAALADPALEQAVSGGQARVLREEGMLSTILLSSSFLQRDPEAAERFMAACTDAAWFVASHRQPCEGWAAPLSDVSPSVLETLFGVNNVYHARSVLDVSVDPQPVAEPLQHLADRLGACHVLSHSIKVAEYVDSDAARRSKARFKGYYDPGSVRILQQ